MEYSFEPCLNNWDLYKNGSFIYSFDDIIITKEMNVQDVLDAVVTGIDVMSNNLDLPIDMDSEEYPINDEDELCEPWKQFEKGTNRFDVWHWFEDTFHIPVIELMTIENR